MDFEKSRSPSPRPLLFILIAVGIVGFVVWAAIPNFVRGGPGKITGIVNRLRQIEAAKEEWAIEHNFTNTTQLNRELTPAELAPYMLPEFTNKIYWAPFCGEVYSIVRLNEPARAQFTRDFRESSWPKNWTLPKGTIIKMGTNTYEEFVVPDPGSEYVRLLNEARGKK